MLRKPDFLRRSMDLRKPNAATKEFGLDALQVSTSWRNTLAVLAQCKNERGAASQKCAAPLARASTSSLDEPMAILVGAKADHCAAFQTKGMIFSTPTRPGRFAASERKCLFFVGTADETRVGLDGVAEVATMLPTT